MNYIVRSTSDRNLIVDGKERNFHEVAHSVKLTTKYKINNPNQQIVCGIRRVKLRLYPHPRKHPDTIDTWLVVARFSPDEEGKQGGFFYFFM